MDMAVLILAATSIPILAHSIYWLMREREVDMYYGIASGIYTFSAAIGVSYGFPGNMVMPGAFALIGIGAIHAFFAAGERSKIAKGAIFLSLAFLILLMGVLM